MGERCKLSMCLTWFTSSLYSNLLSIYLSCWNPIDFDELPYYVLAIGKNRELQKLT